MVELANNLSHEELNPLSMEEQNELVCRHTNDVVKNSVPKFINRSSKSLPKFILDLINEKKELRKKLRKSKDQQLKVEFYKVANSVRSSIKEYRESKWNHLLEKFGPHPVSTSPFWSIINRAKNPKQKPSIPTLREGHLEFKSEKENIELFKSILKVS